MKYVVAFTLTLAVLAPIAAEAGSSKLPTVSTSFGNKSAIKPVTKPVVRVPGRSPAVGAHPIIRGNGIIASGALN